MNKFEQVSSDDHQMSLARESQVWCPGEGVPTWPFPGGTPPCDLPPPPGQTDACENITFPPELLILADQHSYLWTTPFWMQ